MILGFFYAGGIVWFLILAIWGIFVEVCDEMILDVFMRTSPFIWPRYDILMSNIYAD